MLEAGKMEPNEVRIKILNFLRFTGPSLPINMSKGCDIPTLIVSAYLSEMSENKQIKISHLKYGGSPLYYLPGQESYLENFVSHLNAHDREIFLKLKENGVLEDIKLEPLYRVGLRNIPDFAFPVRVVHNGQEKLFWRIYSLNDQQSLERIKEILEPKAAPKSDKIIQEPKLEVREEKPEKKPRKKREKKEEKAEEMQKEANELIKELKSEVKEERKAEELIRSEEILERKEDKPKEEKIEVTEKKPEIAEKKPERKKKGDIKAWFSENKIGILSEIFIKPKEANFLVSVTSGLGDIDFFCVFKDKKSISEADIVMAYQQAQDAKLPLFFVTTGKLSKKSQQYISSLKIIFKQI